MFGSGDGDEESVGDTGVSTAVAAADVESDAWFRALAQEISATAFEDLARSDAAAAQFEAAAAAWHGDDDLVDENDVWDPGYMPVDTGPDAVERVVELAAGMAVYAADRAVALDAARREALADGSPYGGAGPAIALRSLRLELAAAMRITERGVETLMAQAEALVHRYPAVLQSLSRARMTERHADVLIDLVDPVEPELRDAVVAQAVVLAETEPVGTFRRSLTHLIDTVRSATLEARHTEALQRRRVVVEPGTDGMAWLHAYLPAVEAHAIHGRLTAIAKAVAAHHNRGADPAEGVPVRDARTLDQTRADVFGDLLIDGHVAAHPDDARGIQATVAITVPALHLLDGRPGEPAVVEGVGPIPLSRARDLCGGATGWMRILTHPETGMVLSVGRDQYRPPASLRRLVQWRSDRCMGPGCGVPASRAQIDHNTAWQDGGRTDLTNLCPFCVGHHTLKHHGGWTVTQPPAGGGDIHWTSPTGRHYVVHPKRRVPVFTTRPPDPGADVGPPF